jgi:hypothetical protein
MRIDVRALIEILYTLPDNARKLSPNSSEISIVLYKTIHTGDANGQKAIHRSLSYRLRSIAHAWGAISNGFYPLMTRQK